MYQNSSSNSSQKLGENSGILIFVSGIGLLMTILITQYLFIMDISLGNNQINLTEDKFKLLAYISIPTFVIILFSLVLTLLGIGLVLKSWMEKEPSVYFNSIKDKTRVIIGRSLQLPLCKRLFWVSVFAYFVLILFSSNTILYRPLASFSSMYGVKIPSLHIVGCCGQPGTYPVLTLYVTDQFGLMFIPVNLILSSFLSVLVGINFLLAVYKFQNRFEPLCSRNAKFFCALGASVGLFAGCPACGGNLLLSVLGTGTALAGGITTTIAYYQPHLIIISLLMLLVLPVIVITKTTSYEISHCI